MKVVVREAAARDVEDIFNWISKDNPRAAIAVTRRIGERVNRLAVPGLAHMGRPGLAEGTRELVEAPYIIVYMVDEPADEIVVLSIVHGARNRQDQT
jgi:addiction module RelE/StbE family toxin